MKSKKIFIIKLVAIVSLTVFLLPEMILKTGLIQKHILIGKEVYEVMEKSNRATDNKTIILGDSVARSLYPTDVVNRKYDSLASSATISMVGQYILIKNILKKNKGITDVVLIYHPFSFEDKLDQIYVFHYFLRPFFCLEYMEFLSKTAFHRIRKIPSWFFALLPIVKLSNVSPGIESYAGFRHGGIVGSEYMPSDLSIEYLRRIKKLLEDNRTRFRVVSPFMDKSYERTNSSGFREIIKKNNLDGVFGGYFNFAYVGSEHFSDHVHYRDAKMFGDNPLLLGTDDDQKEQQKRGRAVA